MTILQKHLVFIPLFVVVFAGVFGLVVMVLWNWLMPTIFGFAPLSYCQAVGLLVLCKILFGGVGSGHHGHGHCGCRSEGNRLRQRWESMTPEERERFVESHTCKADTPETSCDGK